MSVSNIVLSNKNHLCRALWTNRRDAVIVDVLCVYQTQKGCLCVCVCVVRGVCALWGVWAVELWSSRAKQPKTKAHNSRGLHSCCTAFNANKSWFSYTINCLNSLPVEFLICYKFHVCFSPTWQAHCVGPCPIISAGLGRNSSLKNK